MPYSQDAVVPIPSWREVEYSERRLLFNANPNSALDKSLHIGIIRLSECAIAPLLDMGVAFAQTPEDCYLLSKHPDYQAAIDYLVDQLPFLDRANQVLTMHPVSLNPIGLPTVTYNQLTQKFIGLHLDSWDKLPIEQRHLSTNRICINIGLEDRFLLFINLTLANMMQLLQTDPTFSLSSPAAIRHHFLARYPNYPVVKLRIAPGEAYIAPTENMIHDGCTSGKQFFDITLTIRGHIELPFCHFAGEDIHEQKVEEFTRI